MLKVHVLWTTDYNGGRIICDDTKIMTEFTQLKDCACSLNQRTSLLSRFLNSCNMDAVYIEESSSKSEKITQSLPKSYIHVTIMLIND